MIEALMTLLLAGACLGDANGSGVIGVLDFSALRQAWGSSYGDVAYNPLVDYDASGTVGTADFAVLQQAWAQPCRRILSRGAAAHCSIEWASGAHLPLWGEGRCIRVPVPADFTPTMTCDGSGAEPLPEGEGVCG